MTEARDALLTRWAGHPDREVGRVVLERLAADGLAPDALATVVDEVVAADVAHAVHVLGAVVALRSEPGMVPTPPDGYPPSATATDPCTGRSPTS